MKNVNIAKTAKELGEVFSVVGVLWGLYWITSYSENKNSDKITHSVSKSMVPVSLIIGTVLYVTGSLMEGKK